ncbi:LysR family transcriptional regulator [Enterobacter huaxiensis]|uniref:LysR family transcriptional regulator n=1 Tax=Enterobacter huaxiensis TaxID=2494702 RepID=UPI000E768BBA|nr:LysR family transcriptional regulator [Enterobacter huaxiensis]UNC52663.1 LysR family transcriptional regulator [Enterobacter huaxiensis]
MTVVEQGTIKEASVSLNLSSSPVSRRIKMLEDWLGFKVFIRKHKDLILTRKGEELYARVAPLYKSIHGIQHAYLSSKKKISLNKSLRIGMECSYNLKVGKFINKLRKKNATENIFNFECSKEKSLDLILSGEIDAIITYRNINHSKLHRIEIIREKAHFMLRADGHDSMLKRESDHIFIIDQQAMDHESVDKITSALYMKYRHAQLLAVNDMNSYLPMILSGRAIGIISEMNATSFVQLIEEQKVKIECIDTSLELKTYMYILNGNLKLIDAINFVNSTS